MRAILLLQWIGLALSLEGRMKLEEFAKLSTCVSHYALQTQGEFEDMNLLPLVRWAAGGRPGSFVELGAARRGRWTRQVTHTSQ